MPTLEEALDACGDLLVNVELKEPLGKEVLPIVDGRNVLVSSFDLATVDAIAGRVPTAWILTVPPPRAIATCASHGHVAIHPHHRALRKRFVEVAHASGLAVHTWTVDSPARYATFSRWGVDAVITNDPAALRA